MHGALYGPTNAQVLAERLEIDLLVLIGKSRPAPDHKCTGYLCEVGRQVSRNTVREIVLLRIIVEVRKGKDDKRQAGSDIGPGRCLSLCLLRFLQSISADRLPDIPIDDEAGGHQTGDRS